MDYENLFLPASLLEVIQTLHGHGAVLSPARDCAGDCLQPGDFTLMKLFGYQSCPATRTVDNHIRRLRQKLEKDSSDPVHFRTVHSVGYKFVP